MEEKGLKGRRRRLRISGGSVRLGRTKIARSIRKSQPSPHNRLFQPLSLLLLFLLLLQATRPWQEISTGIFSFSSAPLDFSQLGIGHHCWKTDSKLAPAVLSTCNIVAGSGCVDHELGEDQPPSRSPPPQLAFSHPPPCFLFSSISAENPLLAAPRASLAEKSGNFSCHWPPRLFPGHCGPLSGGLSPAIVARSRQDSFACNLPILQAIGKFSLIKTAPVSANNPNQGWLYLGDLSKVWARLDGHLWAAGQQLLSEAQMLGAPTRPL